MTMGNSDTELYKLLNELIAVETRFPAPESVHAFLTSPWNSGIILERMKDCYTANKLVHKIKASYARSVISPIFNTNQLRLINFISNDQKLKHEYFFNYLSDMLYDVKIIETPLKLSKFDSFAEESFDNDDYAQDYPYSYGYQTWLTNKSELLPITSSGIPKLLKTIHSDLKECFGLCLWLPALSLTRTLLEIAIRELLNKHKVAFEDSHSSFRKLVLLIPGRKPDKYTKDNICKQWHDLSKFVHLYCDTSAYIGHDKALEHINITIKYVNILYEQ